MSRLAPPMSPHALVALAALALLTLAALKGCATGDSGSSNEPRDSTAPAQTASSDAELGHAVTGKAPPATGGLPSIVLLEPQSPRDWPVPMDLKVMDQFGTAFIPSLLLVRAGQPVQFRNSEDVLHNIHVVDTDTGATVLNIATPILGSYDHTFKRAGAYAVSCDIHTAMAADILVTSTPYAVVADNDGTFSFSDVPSGSYILTVRNGARRIEQVVEITGPRPELILDTKP